jgi:hypothetical protein
MEEIPEAGGPVPRSQSTDWQQEQDRNDQDRPPCQAPATADRPESCL